MRMAAALRPVLDLPARLGLARAPDAYYALPVPLADERRPLAIAWLALGLAALVASGIFSLLLVAARTPFLAPLFPVADFFHVALVVHVDLSVLVWFAACAGLVWTVNGERRLESLGWAALAFAAVGTVLMSAAPFLGRGQPVMSNYVPVLDDPLFLAGLVVFGVGFAGVTLRALAAPARVGRALDGVDAQRFGLNAAAVSAAIALGAFAWSWLALPDRLGGQRYYELLFWGGGHVLQFTWTLLMLVAWLWLATLAGLRLPLSPRVTALLFGVALAAVFATPAIYLAWPVTSLEHRQLLTWLMRFGGGLAILPLGVALLVGLVRAGPASEDARPLRAALLGLGCALRVRGRDRVPDPGLGRARAGALSRLDRRRDARADGARLRARAAARARPAVDEARDAAAAPLRRRPAAAHHRARVVGRLRRAAQGGGERAGAAHDARR